MPILLDTRALPQAQRAQAVIATLGGTDVAPRVELDDHQAVDARIAVSALGDIEIMRWGCTTIWCTRTAETARIHPCDRVAVVLQASGRGLYSTGSSPQIVEQGRLVICDVNRPFEYAWRGRGALVALNIPVDALGVPTDVIAAAAERASSSSPLYRLVCRHVRDLALDAERLSASTVAGSVGSTTIELIRALMASTTDLSLAGREVGEDTLITQVRIYVNQHLGDPDLSPDTVAAGLAISARQLYRVCARVGLGPEQLIIASRLDRARQELAQPGARSRTIANIARRCGFKDPTHFARRFRAAYGELPSEWQLRCAHERDDGVWGDWA
jgi:AraC-like DNA-binding protein